MAQTEARKLDVGDFFPLMNIQVVDAKAAMQIPHDLTAEYTVLLVYRGKW